MYLKYCNDQTAWLYKNMLLFFTLLYVADAFIQAT